MDKKSSSDHTRSVYVLRVSIKNIKPQIWRKLRVPDDYTLGDLHYILQIAFGWEDDHMHSFTINETEYGAIGVEFGFDEWDDVIDEDSVCLCDLYLPPKKKFSYLYDFGDSWKHEITVSKIVPIDPENAELTLPCCLEGERAGPLEDSGGPWGYANMIETLKDPSCEGYEDIHEWAGDFDPEYLDLIEINACLEQMFKPQADAEESSIEKAEKTED